MCAIQEAMSNQRGYVSRTLQNNQHIGCYIRGGAYY